MVTIKDYHAHENELGETFFTLSLEGGVELVRSKATGRFYATVRKVRISCTFDESTCKSLVGGQFPGTIKRVDCDPYSYTIKETGEEITLEHTYEYFPEEASSQEEAVLQD